MALSVNEMRCDMSYRINVSPNRSLTPMVFNCWSPNPRKYASLNKLDVVLNIESTCTLTSVVQRSNLLCIVNTCSICFTQVIHLHLLIGLFRVTCFVWQIYSSMLSYIKKVPFLVSHLTDSFVFTERVSASSINTQREYSIVSVCMCYSCTITATCERFINMHTSNITIRDCDSLLVLIQWFVFVHIN